MARKNFILVLYFLKFIIYGYHFPFLSIVTLEPTGTPQLSSIQNFDETPCQENRMHYQLSKCEVAKAVHLEGNALRRSTNDDNNTVKSKAKPSRGFKYQLEMPTLSLPPRRSRTEKRHDNPTISLSIPPPAEPSTSTTIIKEKNVKNNSLPVPQFSLSTQNRKIPSLSKRSKMSIDTKTLTAITKNPPKMPKVLEVTRSQKAFSDSIPTLVPGTAPTSGHVGASPQLPIGSSSHKSSTQFKFKVPKHPIGAKSFSNSSNTRIDETSQNVHPQTATCTPANSLAVSGESNSTDINCSNSRGSNLESSNMEWSSSSESRDQTSFSKSSSDQPSHNRTQTSTESNSSSAFQCLNYTLQNPQNPRGADFGEGCTESSYTEEPEIVKANADESGSHFNIASQSFEAQQGNNECHVVEANTQELEPSQGFQPQSDYFSQQRFPPPQDFGSHTTMVIIYLWVNVC